MEHTSRLKIGVYLITPCKRRLGIRPFGNEDDSKAVNKAVTRYFRMVDWKKDEVLGKFSADEQAELFAHKDEIDYHENWSVFEFTAPWNTSLESKMNDVSDFEKIILHEALELPYRPRKALKA